MDLSSLNGRQCEALRRLGSRSETVDLDVYGELKSLGIVCTTPDGQDHLSELGESLYRQLISAGRP
jgi:hypothetical protein